MEPVVQTSTPPKSGGGGLFGIIGAGIGGLVGVVAGGPQGAVQGLSAGQGLGTAIGNVAQPPQAGKTNQGIPLDNTPPPSFPSSTMEDHPEVQLATLMDAKQALQQAGSVPGMFYDDANNQLDQAIGKTKTSLGIS